MHKPKQRQTKQRQSGPRSRSHADRGKPHHPPGASDLPRRCRRRKTQLLVYGYATGVFSSRKLERATYDSVAFRFIAVNQHPDHDTIATFRRRFLKDIEALFVRVLELAREMGLLKLGTVALDGTKIHANASRHSALSYEHATKIEAQLHQRFPGQTLMAASTTARWRWAA